MTTSAAITATDESAFVSDISGVCKRRDTWRMSSRPRNEDIANTSRFNRMSFVVSDSCIALLRCEALLRRLVHDLSFMREERSCDEIVVAIDRELALLREVERKREAVARVEDAGVHRN